MEYFSVFASIIGVILFIVLMIIKAKIHPFLALTLGSIVLGFLFGMSPDAILKSAQTGFGNMMSNIGLVVIFGSIIGVGLEKSGALIKIGENIVNGFGEKRSIESMSFLGAGVSIPVFCDSAFILLNPLTKTISKLGQVSKKALVLSLASGLYTTHCLVPPTPGPMAAASNLGAQDYLGMVILVGIVFTFPVLLVSQYLAKRLGSIDDSFDIEIDSYSSIDQTNQKSFSLFTAYLPMLLPVVMIALGTVLKANQWSNPISEFILSPSISLFIGVVLCFVLLAGFNIDRWSTWSTEGVSMAGPVLIVTAAGGMLGSILKEAPFEKILSSWLVNYNVSMEVIAIIMVFLIAALLKSAQGSSTAAMIITSSLLAPIAPALMWDTNIELAIVVMVIAGGAMAVSHVNDSYFWVISQFGKYSSSSLLRSFTIITLFQAITVLICGIIGILIF